jgi:beta-glucosidase
VQEKFISRYIDEQNSPQFSFGFGLTYTQFAYSKPEISVTQLKAKALNDQLQEGPTDASSAMTVSATITNTGNAAAEEVAQLYVGVRGTDVEEPVRKLAGFARVNLAPGESKRVSFALGTDTLAVWDLHNQWRVEPSMVRVWVSPDAAHGEPAQFEIVP